jgi:hypothetical protein
MICVAVREPCVLSCCDAEEEVVESVSAELVSVEEDKGEVTGGGACCAKTLAHSPSRATTANNLSLSRVVVRFFMDTVWLTSRFGIKFPQSGAPPFPTRRCDEIVQSFDNVETKAEKNKAQLVDFATDSLPHVVLGVGA